VPIQYSQNSLRNELNKIKTIGIVVNMEIYYTTVYSKRRKFDGKWYYLSSWTRGLPMKKSEANSVAKDYRNVGVRARVVKVKGGYLVYRRDSTPGFNRMFKVRNVKNMYYCRKCRKWHNKSSKIGKKHKKKN